MPGVPPYREVFAKIVAYDLTRIPPDLPDVRRVVQRLATLAQRMIDIRVPPGQAWDEELSRMGDGVVSTLSKAHEKIDNSTAKYLPALEQHGRRLAVEYQALQTLEELEPSSGPSITEQLQFKSQLLTTEIEGRATRTEQLEEQARTSLANLQKSAGLAAATSLTLLLQNAGARSLRFRVA